MVKKQTKKHNRKALEAKLWKVLSELCRRAGTRDGYGPCFTCGREVHWKSSDAGHCFSRRHAAIKYDLDNVRRQCKQCNSFGQSSWNSSGPGERAVFKAKLAEQGVDVEDLERRARQGKRPGIKELESLLDSYMAALEEVRKVT